MSVRSLHHESWKNWAKTKGTAPREIKFKFEKGQIVDTAIRPTLILIACGQKKIYFRQIYPRFKRRIEGK